MFVIKNEGLQLMPGSKILKAEEYTAIVSIGDAMKMANEINAKVLNQANAESDRLIAEANARAEKVVNEANVRSDNLVQETNEKVRLLVEESNAKAKKLIDEAVAKQNEILASAKARYEEEAKKGREDGYASGKQELADKMMEIVSKNAENFAKFESEMVGIVSKAVQRIIGEIDQKDLITNIVKTAVKNIKNQKQAVLKVSAAEAQTIRDRLDEILVNGDGIKYLEISADSRLKRGTCVIETEIGVVDASLDVQMEAITKAITKALK
ncbi:MAG: HrpE/YscL family type III secretion apparatus protein [Puniceicoccales bacterium]|jgi:type III secretion protein L|nr:HrpE/YscL family type III secretion apparatus protein [Puniceicoccales bacterium]